MNKKIIFFAVLVGIFCITGFILADSVTIPNPINATDFKALLTNISTVVGQVLTSLGTIMIIVAGILYLTSAGDAGKLETAKKALIYAVIGIAVGVAASTIPAIISSILNGA